MAEAKYKIMQNDLGWIVATVSNTKDTDDGWYYFAGPFDRLEDAETYLRNFIARLADEEMKKTKRERDARYYDEQGFPAAFAGVGAAGVQYVRPAHKGYGAGGNE